MCKSSVDDDDDDDEQDPEPRRYLGCLVYLFMERRKVKVKRPGLVVSPVKYSPPTSSMMNKVAPIKPVANISPRAPTPPSIPVPKRPEPPKPKPIPPPPPQKNPELMRQPIRDRIIHILALRPYKRPELLMKLKHEGEEAEIIRKRKQQHLNSNNESPPSNSQSNTSPLQKRFTNESLPELPPSKKQRISHYKAEQPRPTYGNSSTESSSNSFPKKSFSPGPVPPSMPNGFGFHQEDSNSNQKSPTSDSYPNTPPPLKNVSNHSTSSLNQRTREDNTRNHSPGSNNSMGVPLRKPSFQKVYPMSRNQRHDVEERTPSEPHHPKSYVNSDMGRTQTLSHPQSVDSVSSSKVSPDSNTRYRVEESKTELCSKTSTNGYVNNNNSINKGNYNRNKSSYIDRSKVTSTTNGSCSNSPHSSCDSRDGMDYN
ncbi:RNA polymerase II elongation factor ELL2, partial [Caerostris extrusa]